MTAKPAPIPAAYIDSFLEMVAAADNVVVLTYDDLDFGDDWDYDGNYPGELAIWQASIASGERDPEKIYLFIQHDVDAQAQRTMRMLRVQAQLGIRSNLMIFNRPINRAKLSKEGIVETDEYALDERLMRELDDRGWVVGYHNNSFEQALFDEHAAELIFARDVDELRRRFHIRFFCPHGGVRDADGRSNVHMGLPDSLRTSLRWVLNRHTIRFAGSFSDGGLGSRGDKADTLDLRLFVERWKPGRRYRMLIHPQYYDTEHAPLTAFAHVGWYQEILRRANDGSGFSDWWPTPASTSRAAKESEGPHVD